MSPEALWTAIGSLAALSGLVLTMLRAWLTSIKDEIGSLRVEAKENIVLLSERIDSLEDKIEAKYVRKEFHDEVIRRIDLEISAAHRAITCPRTRD